ncbi:hypothetical protein RIF29_41926 [Crotalaria pallida]|uniref:Uncharacterized protein n=1 Tax=Crotalaria pallida TaxID=3830 RepID=A0AAN9HPV0_CROPI
MNTTSLNWRWPRKAQWLITSAILLLQNFLLFSQIFAEATSSVHIVYLGDKIYHNPETTKMHHFKMLSSLLGSKEAARSSMLYSYKHGFSGFAARLTKSQAEEIEKFPEVVSVIPNRVHKLQTTRSWDFIGIRHSSSKSSFTERNLGEGTIIGVIDTGIWPESESFNDEAMGQIPSKWKGVCEEGEQFNSSNCNKKIIGSRSFIKGLTAHTINILLGNDTNEYLSVRDYVGHGTHTASTAAGYFVKNASYSGLAYGLARGGAPLAHIAIYKACWGPPVEGCSSADLLKAFDKAIHDGVDVLSVSIGKTIPVLSYVDQHDATAIGSFHATAKGITVVCSAGNAGPISQTIVNTAPWIVTVAATTIDRTFQAGITLGNNHTLWGQSIDTGKRNLGFVGLAYSERVALDPTNELAKDCQYGTLNATMVAGKIVLCFSLSKQQNIVAASVAVKEAGGVGLIYAQFHEDGLDQCGVFPCIKPDIAAPGVDILAASPPKGTTKNSGIAALIKSKHPTWSPAAIRSALVTTASQTGTDGSVISEDGSTKKAADPFDIGGGHVNPNKALDPGLIYNITTKDYIHFLCSMGYSNESISKLTKSTIKCKKEKDQGLNLNLPSISVPNLKKSAKVMRTVTNVGNITSVYKAKVKAPHGIRVRVEPQILSFNSASRVLSFNVSFLPTKKLQGDYKFGSLTWTDGKHFVRTPIAVRTIQS